MLQECTPSQVHYDIRNAVMERINRLVQPGLMQYTGMHVAHYGSFTSGLFAPNGDLDIAIEGTLELNDRVQRGGHDRYASSVNYSLITTGTMCGSQRDLYLAPALHAGMLRKAAKNRRYLQFARWKFVQCIVQCTKVLLKMAGLRCSHRHLENGDGVNVSDLAKHEKAALLRVSLAYLKQYITNLVPLASIFLKTSENNRCMT